MIERIQSQALRYRSLGRSGPGKLAASIRSGDRCVGLASRVVGDGIEAAPSLCGVVGAVFVGGMEGIEKGLQAGHAFSH